MLCVLTLHLVVQSHNFCEDCRAIDAALGVVKLRTTADYNHETAALLSSSLMDCHRDMKDLLPATYDRDPCVVGG